MKDLKNLNIKRGWVLFFACAEVCWLILVIMKAFGWVSYSWPFVLLGFLWGPCEMLACTAAAVAILLTVIKVKETIRKRKRDRRIKAQAKAAGVWENIPALGGRALDLKAMELDITREPGETDRELRVRMSKMFKAMHSQGVVKLYVSAYSDETVSIVCDLDELIESKRVVNNRVLMFYKNETVAAGWLPKDKKGRHSNESAK